MKKSVLAVLCAIFVLATALAVIGDTDAIVAEVSAAEVVASGAIDENVSWTRDDEGVLTISGEGEIPADYSWGFYSVTKVVIGSGITDIGSGAFARFQTDFEVVFEEGSKLEAIGDGAFESTYVTKIVIPASVKTIGAEAFWGCGPLSEVSFEEGSCLETIGEEAFMHTGITEIEIPASVTSIGDSAFKYCEVLESVTFNENSQLEIIGKDAFFSATITEIVIPKGVTAIGEGAFYNCDYLERVEFAENSVFEVLGEDVSYSDKYYHNGIFSDCDSLTEVVLPESLTFIGTNTFTRSAKLKTVNLEDCHKLEAIGVYAFGECEELNEVTIPENVKYIDHCAFDFCYGLTKLTFAENSTIEYLEWGAFRGTCVEEIEIPASMITIGAYAFEECTELKTVTFEKNCQLDEIRHNAFASTGITSITIPASVRLLGDSVFYSCKKLVSVSFEENSILTSLTTSSDGDYRNGQFADCTSLKSIILPERISSLDSYTFYNCTSLEQINLADMEELISIGHYTFYGCSKLEAIALPEGLYSIGDSAFQKCEKLTKIHIPANITKINKYAFNGCLNLSEVTFAENSRVDEIGDSAFSGCIALSVIQLPDSLEIIQDYAFEYCPGLTEIDIPDAVEYVGDSAFAGTAIKEIYIPALVSYFGWMNGEIEKFIVDTDNMYYSTDEVGALYSKDKKVFIQYPAGCDAKEFVISDGVEIIGTFAFPICYNLERIVMPDSVTEIADAAFGYAFFVKEIVLSQKLEKIGSEAFALCFCLEQLEIPASVTELGSDIFTLALSLKEVKIYSKALQPDGSNIGVFEFSYESEEDRELICELYCDAYFMDVFYKQDYIIGKYGSVDEFYKRIDECQDKIKDEYKTDAYTVYCYKGSSAEAYVQENNIKYAYLCEHIEETIPAVAPTCTKDGTTAGVKCSVCGDILVAPEKDPMKGHTSGTAVKENEVKATCKVAAYYENVVYCTVCGAELSRTPVNGEKTSHTEVSVPAVAPTCTKDGTTAGVKCSVCDDILSGVTSVTKKGHSPVLQNEKAPEIGVPGYTGDMVCSVCGEIVTEGEDIPAIKDDSAPECDHICHKEGVLGILWKIISFFAKLFKTNPVCECGAAHY